MTIVDLDELREERDRTKFRLFGKEYTIPDMSYALTLELEKVKEQLIKAEDYKTVMECTIESILLVIPELKDKELREKASPGQLRGVVDLINKDFMGGGKKEEKEILHYRKKYGDEFRKKGQRTRERKNI